MKQLFSEKTAGKIFNFLALAMYALLFHYCLELTGENSAGLMDEHIFFRQDSVLWNAFKFFLAVCCLHLVGKLSVFLKEKKKRNILLAVCCIISGIISLYWVINSGTEPQGDQAIVSGFADVFNSGDYYGIQKGGYIAMYPQQLGFVTFLRLFYTIFGQGNYFAFQIFSAVMVPAIVLFGCMVVRELSEDDARTELYYLLFSVTCFPMYAYSSFVYGDLVSIPFALISVWAFLSALRKFKLWKLVGMGVSIGFAVMLRTNVVILAVAMLIAVLAKLLKRHNWRQHLALGAGIIAGVLLFQVTVKAAYLSEWGEDAKGIPPLCFIVMGLNDDNSYAGWYNIYNAGCFATSDFDTKAANRRALTDLNMYIGIYKNDPQYMINFFARKMNAQWNAPMYQSIVMNNNVVREQSSLIKNIFEGGKAASFLERYAKVYQLVVYGSILFLLLCKRREWENIEKYVLLIAVFGGFLFSLIWEAKTRYVFPYLLMEIPYVAMGMNEIAYRFSSRKSVDRRMKNE